MEIPTFPPQGPYITPQAGGLPTLYYGLTFYRGLPEEQSKHENQNEAKQTQKDEKESGFRVRNLWKTVKEKLSQIVRPPRRNKCNKSVRSQCVLQAFHTRYNQVQLVSRVTGLCVQIVTDSNERLVLDATGACIYCLNSKWEVDCAYGQMRADLLKERLTARLHVNRNYLAIENGIAVVRSDDGIIDRDSPETEFLITKVNGIDMDFVVFESVAEPGFYVSFSSTGEPCKAQNKDDPTTHFAVQMISVCVCIFPDYGLV